MKEIKQQITHILVDKMGLRESEVTEDASILRDLGIDSLDYAELVLDFEQTFRIRIPDIDAEKLKTIRDAMIYIDAKLQAGEVYS